MNAFNAYEIYIAIKTHFTKENYDFHKFNGKTKASVSSFDAREDRAFFFKIANRYSKSKLTDLYVSNFVDNPSLWIGDLLDDMAEEIYKEWQKRIESLTYYYTEDCDGILNWCLEKGFKFNDLFKVTGNDHPILVKMALQHVISLETFIILNRILDFGTDINRKLDDIIWKEFWLKVCKYEPFLHIDIIKCKQILRQKIEKEYPSLI